MTKRTRTILFLVCLFLFLLSAPATVFYSQGYRIDFDSKKFTQTGAFYFKVWPKSIQIYLDGKLAKKTDFFFGSALIEELLPKKYGVEIKKEGYHSWQKNLEIKEKEVTEAKNIVLVSENPDFEILGKEIENFYFSPNEKKIIFKVLTEEGWALKLFDLERSVKSHLIEEKDISKTGVDFFDLKFSPDSRQILLEVGLKEQLKYFLLEIDKTPPILTEIKEPSPSFEATFKSTNVVVYKTIGQDIYYLDNSGHLFKSDFSFEPKTRITEIPFKVLPETEYQLKVFSNFIFLKERQILYQFNPDLKSFEKFFEPISSMKISPEFKKLAYFNDYEIWILFLEDNNPPPTHRAGDRVFLARFSDKIGGVFWYTAHYLVFNTGDKIKIAEIDDRDRINIVDLAEFENPEIFWNQNYKKLYILSNGNLYSSESLLP